MVWKLISLWYFISQIELPSRKKAHNYVRIKMKLSTALFLLASIAQASVADARSPKRIRQRNGSRGSQQPERRTKGDEGKGKGYTQPPPDSATSEPESSEISNDGSHLDLICELYQSYNNLVRAGSGSINFCAAFETEVSLLCPNDYERGKICEGVALGSALDVSMVENYCVPIFDELFRDSTMVTECVDACAAYSDDCCALTCA